MHALTKHHAYRPTCQYSRCVDERCSASRRCAKHCGRLAWCWICNRAYWQSTLRTATRSVPALYRKPFRCRKNQHRQSKRPAPRVRPHGTCDTRCCWSVALLTVGPRKSPRSNWQLLQRARSRTASERRRWWRYECAADKSQSNSTRVVSHRLGCSANNCVVAITSR